MMKRLIFSFLGVLFLILPAHAQHFVPIDAALLGVAESSARWIDTDRDGDIDALVMGEFFRGSEHGVQTRIYRNFRNNRFSLIETGLPNLHRGDIDIGDFNLNGINDIALMGERADGTLVATIYRGNSNGTYSPTGIQITPVRDGSIRFGDFDNDGDLDILISGESKNGPVTKIYRNDRDGRFTEIDAGLEGVRRGVAVWFDYNLDGNLDVFLTGINSNGQPFSMLYQSDGNQGFFTVETGIIGLKNSNVAIGDYDNDGDPDLAIMGEMANGRLITRLYRNDRNGNFSLVPTPFEGVRHGFMDWGDFDDDGDLDLLLSGESSTGAVSKVYRNDRANGFREINAGLIGLYMSSGQWGDFDLDGDLDILISGMTRDYQYVSMIYRNDGTISMQPVAREAAYEEMEESIFNNTVGIPERAKPVFYYVYSSSYSNLHGGDNKDYFLFVSPVKRPRFPYDLQDHFNPIIRRTYPNWPLIDQGNIVTNGFASTSEAERSRSRIIDEYRQKGFRVIEVNW